MVHYNTSVTLASRHCLPVNLNLWVKGTRISASEI